MTPNSSPQPRPGPRDGGSIRKARAIRTRTIRRRVATGAVALFVGAWALIAVELVTGHDPALAARKTSTVASSSAQPATSTSSAASTTSSNNSSATSSVTTRQS
jgi:hypothetical protein